MADKPVYKSAQDFRKALEARLQNVAASRNIELIRLRRMVAFERLLARLFQSEKTPWLLKGGYALEFRMREKARATRDVDLAMNLPAVILKGNPDPKAIHGELQKEASKDLGDWFQIRIGEAKETLWGPPGGGYRFPVESILAGREFAVFHLDVGLGDIFVEEPDWMQGHELLNFAGIPPARIALLPKEYQFAEKIHAYTRPRRGPINSRVRDIADLALLIEEGGMDPAKAARVLKATFDRYDSHPLPETLNPPPKEWEEPFKLLAQEMGSKPQTVQEAFQIVSAYWNKLKR